MASEAFLHHRPIISIECLTNLLNSKAYFDKNGLARFLKFLHKNGKLPDFTSTATIEAALISFFLTMISTEAKGKLILNDRY